MAKKNSQEEKIKSMAITIYFNNFGGTIFWWICFSKFTY